jgi:hypothetical protein
MNAEESGQAISDTAANMIEGRIRALVRSNRGPMAMRQRFGCQSRAHRGYRQIDTAVAGRAR